MASKKQGTIRQLAESAGSPIDFVSAAGSVRVVQNFISMLIFTLIDFWTDYGVVRAADFVAVGDFVGRRPKATEETAEWFTSSAKLIN
jgi:hypothetical protein